MVVVTETFPSTQPSINQKIDVTSVPAGAEDNWWDAGDSNIVGQMSTSLARAVRLQALIAAVAPDTTGINGKAFRFTGIDSVTGLADITTTLTTDLNKIWAAAIEKIEEGGDLDGTASASGFFGVANGLVSGLTGFASGVLLGLSAGGGLITYAGGSLPPIGKVTDTIPSIAHIDLGGRFSVNTAELSFDSNGVLGATESATFSDLTVTGNTVLQGTLQVNGTASFDSNVTMGDGLDVLGAINANTAYELNNTVIVNSSRDAAFADVTAQNQFRTEENSPAQIIADQNNYDVGDTANVRINSDAVRTITGLLNPANGRRLIISNVGSFDVVLSHEDVSSAAANRFSFSNGRNFRLISGGGRIRLVYDNTISRWTSEALATTTKGDVLVDDGNTLQRLAVGADDQVLTADSAEATGAKWATPAANGGRFKKGFTIENPSASEDISIFFTDEAITIQEIRAVLVGSSIPSVTWTVRHGTDRSAAGAEAVTGGTTTTSTTTGSDVTVFNDATVVADSFVWLETTAQSGTVNELHITIVYTVD